MSRPVIPAMPEAPARRFSREIGEALASGVPVDGLSLHLTLMDASKLKRDPGVAVEHISFSPEGMRFLGVRAVEGGVRASGLFKVEDAPPVAEPVTKPAPKTRAKSTKPKATKAAPKATKAAPKAAAGAGA